MDDFNEPGSPAPLTHDKVIPFGRHGEAPEKAATAKPSTRTGPRRAAGPRKTLTRDSAGVARLMCQWYVLVTGKTTELYRISDGATYGRDSGITHLNHTFGALTFTWTDESGAVHEEDILAGDYFWNYKDQWRRIVSKVVFEPGAPDYVPGGDMYNTYPALATTMVPPGMNATAEDIQPLIDHLMFISDGDADGVAYFLCWLATLYQRPGLKIPSAILLYSRQSRMGKSMLFELLSRVFGPPMVGQAPGSMLHTKWKLDLVRNKRLMVFNELSRADKADHYEELKAFISERGLFAEGKGDKAREVPNTTHCIITTNNSDCLPLMDGDGRFLVLRCEADRRPDEYYQQLGAWMEGPGPALLAGVLAHYKFPAGWDPYAPVPQTKAVKQTQREARGGPLADFICDLIERGKPPFDRDHGNVTGIIEQLHVEYPGNSRSFRLNNRTVPTALQVAGAVSVGPFDYRVGRMTKTARAWVWRNHERWTVTGADGGPAASAALVDAFGEANK
ncbi:primase-helicase family protein [Azotobacter chroococcum]|uniref:primase-helicase family protein n=1 Tax=Azotobacter chroococcum TaxID=353 RepID=UPI0010AEA2A9|nr:primase-helicase family protein [Azotobacter chroococcum]TKD39918.1 hypothetical protein FCG41_11840 [Azotobacter chroococcum]